MPSPQKFTFRVASVLLHTIIIVLHDPLNEKIYKIDMKAGHNSYHVHTNEQSLTQE